MKQNFETVISRVFDHEGLYSDHSKDPGRKTMRGVTQKTLEQWRGEPVTEDDMKNLTEDECKQIYRAWYWNAVHGDELPTGADYCLMDAAVNSGPSRATKWAQSCLGVKIDGHIGPQTLKALCEADMEQFITDYMDEREQFLRSLKTWDTFGRGWLNRINSVEKASKKMSADKKLEHPRKHPVQSKTVMSSMGIGTAQIATAATVFTQVDSGVQYGLLGLAGVTLLLTIYIFRSRLRKWASGVR